MTLGGQFLGNGEQKASDTLASIFLDAGNRVQRDAVSSEQGLQKRRPLLGCCMIFHRVFSKGSNVII